MTILTSFNLDDDGKIDLNSVYNRPDPRSYYQTLLRLDYRIPEAAAAVFGRVIAAIRQQRGNQVVAALDVGSSYGVNAAILKHGYGLSELFGLYGRAAADRLRRDDLVARDRALFDASGDPDLEMIGLDTADQAIRYACDAGIIDAGITANLEARAPTDREASQLREVDVVISTGAIGYVGSATFTRIIECARARPWLALFALRMFPVDEIASLLKSRGYRVFKMIDQTFRQRRFAGQEERREVLARLATLGIDPEARESDGWYHAEFFLAVPAPEADHPPLANLARV